MSDELTTFCAEMHTLVSNAIDESYEKGYARGVKRGEECEILLRELVSSSRVVVHHSDMATEYDYFIFTQAERAAGEWLNSSKEVPK